MKKISYSFTQLMKLHLHDYHVNLKAKMVPFAGYDMPVQYPQGVLKEHLYCRESCGLFDVSHMGQVKVFGEDRMKFVETLTTGEFQTKKSGQSVLCLILNEKAGIIDDTIVAKRDDHIHIVVNAGNKFIDMKQMDKIIKDYNYKVQYEYLKDKPLIAVQGPNAHKVLNEVFGTEYNLDKIPFMFMVNIQKNGIDYQINRCGYTGEDGYEISVENSKAQELCDKLLATKMAQFCGLGARDSLRLEAGLCLHGHEMDDTISPYEAKLMWTVRKPNKETGKYNESAAFIGRDALPQRQKDAKFKRMGFITQSGIARPPCDIEFQGQKIGSVTSGTYSPNLKKGLGFAFVNNEYAKDGTQLQADIRGSKVNITLSPTPFVPQRYYKPEKK
ncbi:unnamed protein product [Paramecium pentaurelia]|uniref:Aminomethyltransferase n=1 Tax=Paramecium pentaurelia TaxID=43138 RepID=A0A8S1W1T4_9CILI|nr:unnamed protein product [Paramecium pentaurelia]